MKSRPTLLIVDDQPENLAYVMNELISKPADPQRDDRKRGQFERKIPRLKYSDFTVRRSQ